MLMSVNCLTRYPSGLAFTFLKALHGVPIGSSMCDELGESLVPIIVDRARTNQVNIHLPKDAVVANKFDPAADTRTANMASGIDDGECLLVCSIVV